VADRPKFKLVIEAQTRPDDQPVEVRLRRLLKVALRAWGFR
jgi:hypothetical protein